MIIGSFLKKYLATNLLDTINFLMSSYIMDFCLLFLKKTMNPLMTKQA